MGKQLDDLLKQVSPDVVALNPDLFGQPEPVIAETPAPKRRNKYGNIPTEFDGRKFDSQKEARRYRQLRLMEQAGEISELRHHHTIELQPAFRNRGGVWEDAIKYTPDFDYMENGVWIVEDLKSPATAKNKEFRIKWRMLEYKYLDDPMIECRIVI